MRNAILTATILIIASASPARAQRTTAMPGSPPLVQIRIMVTAGSAHDAPGKEGLAYLTARLLLEGGYGDETAPTTKEQLAEMTNPWGSGALPGVLVEKETTTIVMTIPREVMGDYFEKVLAPMLTQPVFSDSELDRIRNEVLSYVETSLRNENLEMLGLEALDNYILEGTGRGHLVAGSVEGLGAVTRQDVRRFYNTWYRPENILIGLGSDDPGIRTGVQAAVRQMGRLRDAPTFTSMALDSPVRVQGREMVIVAQPNAPAAVVNIGFPISVLRSDEDFWPLFIANVWFGTHRDSFSHLYQAIRQERGYNYGDYSYIEHFAGRPANLFPPFNTPRTAQYFSIWIRPIAPEYVHHLTKAAMWELENLVRRGLTEDQVEAARKKAKVLYLNYAETGDRLLAARLDDLFYGMDAGNGYLEAYLERIGSVTAEQVNAAIRHHLQTEHVKILIVTESSQAEALAEAVVAGHPAWGKRPADYSLAGRPDGERTVWEVPDERIATLYLDGAWAHYPLGLTAERVRVVPVESLFQSGSFISGSGMRRIR